MDVAANGNATTRLAFAHRRKDVLGLNQAIRAAIRSGMEDAPTKTLLQTETGRRAFASGDRIVFSRNDREPGVNNSMRGILRQVSETDLTIAFDDEPPRAVTSIPIPSGPSIMALPSRSMDRHLAYAAMTRHRDQMRLYINGKDRPAWEQR